MRSGITGRALEKGIARLRLWNPRDYTSDVHRTVDDRPYGGGPGMLMMVGPLRAAIAEAKNAAPDSPVVYLSPQGRVFNQQTAAEFAQLPGVILLAGRYEGIDERVIQADVDQEWSIGDYVLSGGELPAMVMADAVIRLLPGTLGHENSAAEDSFAAGLLDYPHYTRPEKMSEGDVPAVLLSGNHAAIRRWRLQQALGRTYERRPDLLMSHRLSDEEKILLDEYLKAGKNGLIRSNDGE